jgi:hypothetical protein
MLWFLADYTKNFLKRQGTYQSYVYSLLNRFQLQRSKVDKVEADILKEAKDSPQVSFKSKVERAIGNDSSLSKHSCDNDLSDRKWRLELAWLTKALEPALQLCRWALPTGLLMLGRVLHHYGIACGMSLIWRAI